MYDHDETDNRYQIDEKNTADEPTIDTEVEESLHALLLGEPIEFTVLSGVSVRTFADAGLFTHNTGLVIRLADDTEFQLTIIRSR
jgi:hypothetical protein